MHATTTCMAGLPPKLRRCHLSSSCRFAVLAVCAVLMEGVGQHHRVPLEVLFSMFITPPTHKTAQTARTAKRQERSEAWSQGVAQARALRMLDSRCRFLLEGRRGSVKAATNDSLPEFVSIRLAYFGSPNGNR
jgi:hypothetical protein